MSPTATKVPFAEASPAELREAILPQSRDEFDRQYRAAIDNARDTLSLDALHGFLEGWRRVAWVQTDLGMERYEAMMAQAEHLQRTGKPLPGTVVHSEEEMMGLIQSRLAAAR